MRIPIRSCIACRKQENWNELLHLVLVGDQVTPDPDHFLMGRGAWLHPKCFGKAKERGSFSRAFRRSVNNEADLRDLGKYLEIKKE